MRISTYYIQKLFKFLEVAKILNITDGSFYNHITDMFLSFLNNIDYVSEGKHICRKINCMNGVVTIDSVLNLLKSQNKPAYYKFYVYATTPDSKIKSIDFFKKYHNKPVDKLGNEVTHFMIHKRCMTRKFNSSELYELVNGIFTAYFIDALGSFLYSINQLYKYREVDLMLHKYEVIESVRYLTNLVINNKPFDLNSIRDHIGPDHVNVSENMEKFLRDMYHAKKKLYQKLMMQSNEQYHQLYQSNPNYAIRMGGYVNVKHANAKVKKLLNPYIFHYLDWSAPSDYKQYASIVDALKLPEIENTEMTAVCIEI